MFSPVQSPVQSKGFSEKNIGKTVKRDHLKFTLSGRSVSLRDFPNSDLLVTIKAVFQQNVYSIDFTGVVLESIFDYAVKEVEESSTIEELIFTASELSPPQVQTLVGLASRRKGLVIANSEKGFIGNAPHTNWPLYYKTDYLDKAELKDIPELRETPSVGMEIYEARYKCLPGSFIIIGAADGGIMIALMLKGCSNMDGIDPFQSQAELFALKLKKYNLTEVAKKRNVNYSVCGFMDYPPPKIGVNFLIDNYVWSHRFPDDFDKCFKKSVESVAMGGFLCGEFFGKPLTPPRDGITFHTLDEVIDICKKFGLEIVHLGIAPPEVSLKRKDAGTLPWGDLFHVVLVRRPPEDIDPSSYEKVKDVLTKAKSLNQPQIYNVLDPIS